MRRTLLVALCLCVFVSSGCRWIGGGNMGEEAADPLSGPNPFDADPPNDTDRRDEYALVVRVTIMTVSVPLGMASGSEELWSYLDEEAVQPVRSGSLGPNGLRAGVAKQANWQDVADVLDRLTARQLKKSTASCLPGAALSIPLKPRQEMQTVFVFDGDRVLSGRDYPPGDNLLGFFCSLNHDDPSRVALTVVPQIRSTRRHPQFVTGDGHAMMISRPDFYNFEELAFRTEVPSKDVIVIGPGRASRRTSSVGARFLLGEVEGVEYETVLILIPEVVAARRE